LIGGDFDGVLVEYHGFQGAGIFGAPIYLMINRVKAMLAKGKQVRIFTSRVAPIYPADIQINRDAIEKFCVQHFHRRLPITCVKDQNCIEMWDDRAKQMITNTGMTIAEVNFSNEQA
jgi:hypothetical protein